jgi:hypothetical protein
MVGWWIVMTDRPPPPHLGAPILSGGIMVACSKETWELALIWPAYMGLTCRIQVTHGNQDIQVYINRMTLLTSVFKGGKLVMSHPAKVV